MALQKHNFDNYDDIGHASVVSSFDSPFFLPIYIPHDLSIASYSLSSPGGISKIIFFPSRLMFYEVVQIEVKRRPLSGTVGFGISHEVENM